jgi:hypothetical protein
MVSEEEMTRQSFHAFLIMAWYTFACVTILTLVMVMSDPVTIF